VECWSVPDFSSGPSQLGLVASIQSRFVSPKKMLAMNFWTFMMDDFLWEVEKFSLLSWLWFVVGNLSPKKGIFSIF